MGDMYQWENRTDSLLSFFDLRMGGNAPRRVPIQINGNAKVARAQDRRGKSAIGSAATDCFANGIDRAFTISQEMFARFEWGGFNIAIDVPHHAQGTSFE